MFDNVKRCAVILMTSAVILMTSTMMLSSAGVLASDADNTATKKNSAVSANKLPDGFYFVLRWHYDKDKVGSPAENEAPLVNDFHFLEPLEREPIEYVILQTKPFIPIKLAGKPLEDKDEATGKPRLRIELTEDQKEPLAQFTKTHLGGLIAIVIGGDIVTMHKIRGVISDGKVQITRCTQHACETLFTTLLKDSTPSSK